MKCKECASEIEDELKYLAYKTDKGPVYWKLCDPCMKKKWLEYKATLKD